MERQIGQIDCIALDLDQTTLRQDKSLSPATKAALTSAIKAGIEVVVASGRAYSSIPEEVLAIPGIRYAITSNGAAVYQTSDGARCREFLIEEAAVKKILELVPEEIVLEAFVEGQPYAPAAYVADPVHFRGNTIAVEYVQASRKPVEDIRAFIREHAARLDAIDVIVANAEEKSRLRKLLLREAPNILITSSAAPLLEIAHAGAGKHAALAWLAETLGIPMERVAAFGDAENDRAMIEAAGLGVAVANAAESVKASADAVTLSNEEDGVAVMVEKILAAR